MYKLLIVDDEEIIRKGLVKIVELSGSDFQVVGEAKNGKEGIELALKFSPDVIITDVRMPGMDGLEMIDRIKHSEVNIRVIVLSAYTDFQYTRHAIKSGVVDYLVKPVNRMELPELLKKIREDLDSKARLVGTEAEKWEISGVPEQKIDRKVIEAAKSYINSNFFNDISLDSVASHVKMNTNYFSSLFKKETGENFIDYLTRVRIEKAKTLLANPSLKVYEISQIVGYYSTKHFARLFKEMVGMTPTEFRDKIG